MVHPHVCTKSAGIVSNGIFFVHAESGKFYKVDRFFGKNIQGKVVKSLFVRRHDHNEWSKYILKCKIAGGTIQSDDNCKLTQGK